MKRFLDDRKIRDELVVFDPSLEGYAAACNGVGSTAAVAIGTGLVPGSNSNSTASAAEEGQLGCINPIHRDDLVPLLVRILYGRFVSKARGSKAAREQNLARRSAILSFFARMPSQESSHLVHLMMRGMLPQQTLLESAKAMVLAKKARERTHAQAGNLRVRNLGWYDVVTKAACALRAEDVALLSWEKQVGFLHVLEQAIKLIGFGVSEHVQVFLKVVLVMLGSAQKNTLRLANVKDRAGADAADDDENEDDEGPEGEGDGEGGEGEGEGVVELSNGRDANQASKVRNMSLQRMAGK